MHPNDHVNAAQSSNDTFPSAIHVAAVLGTRDLLDGHRHAARRARRAKSDEFADAVKSGRTHLMDATPVTLGQELGGYAAVVDRARERIEAALPRVRELPLGGTAVGTGINAPAGFAEQTIARLNEATGEQFTEARDHFEAQGGRDAIVELSGALRTYAVGLVKICNDLRWMASGPTTGLAEIHLPDLQPGSSIMPGKVNPVIPEATLMVCAQVIGNDAAITFAGASGSFELNVMLPVIARNLLESMRLLANASRLLAACVDGITADRDRMRRVRRVLAVGGHPAQQVRRLRGGRQDRQAGARRRRDHPGDGRRSRVRRAGRAHRGPARRGPRRGEHDDIVSIDDPAHVRSQYLTEDNLETRRSVWHPTADGRDPTTEALDAVVAEQPLRVLEVGPGTGGFAARIAAGAARRTPDGHRPVAAVRRADPRPRRRRPRGRRRRTCRSATRRSTWSRRCGCSTTCPTSTGRSPRSAACCGPAACSWRSPTATATSPTCAARPAATRW